MATISLGYRFNIFVCDHELASSFDSDHIPASQVLVTAASILTQPTRRMKKDGEINEKLVQNTNKAHIVQPSTPTIEESDELPFLQIQSKVTGIPTILNEGVDEVDNSTSATTVGSASLSTGKNEGCVVGEMHGPQNRFKVVKIETVVPKEVGRWTIVDYANRAAPVAVSNRTYASSHSSRRTSRHSSGGYVPSSSHSSRRTSRHSSDGYVP